MVRGLDTIDTFLVLSSVANGRKRGLEVVRSTHDFGIECECPRCGVSTQDDLCNSCGHTGYGEL